MIKKIKGLSNDDAVTFLKSNQANKEQVAYGKADKWLGCYVRAHWYSLSCKKLIGVVGLSITKNTYRIKGLYVQKPYRRRGMGLLLVNELMRKTKLDPKRTTLYATVRSRKLFESVGFKAKHENKYKITFMEKPSSK